MKTGFTVTNSNTSFFFAIITFQKTSQVYFRGSLNGSHKEIEATCLEGMLYKDPWEESDNLEKKSFPDITYLEADYRKLI